MLDRTPSPFARMMLDAPPADQRNLAAILDRQAQRHGDRFLAEVGDQPISFAQCRDRTARFAGTLREAGIRPGDRVAIMCRNRVEFLHLFLGCVWYGAIAVPLNTALRAQQLTHALVNSGSRILILDGELAGHLALVAAPALEEVWLLDPVQDVPTGYAFRPVPPFGEALPLRVIPPAETTAILYTSGTTGPSKGVIYPADQLYWWAAYMNAMMRIEPESITFTALPLFHINALATFVEALISGSACVIKERFSASRFWAEAIEAKATHTYLIGSIGSILLAQPPSPLDRQHRIHTIFGSSVRNTVWAEFSARFGIPRRVGGYGSTESNAIFFAQDGWEVQGNMGRVADGFQAIVADQNDAQVPDGEVGEMLLRSDVPFAFATGYWNMPEATVSAWRNLWFHTGDLVTRSSDGVFRFVGRLKESIRRSGENISSWEVEQALLTHDCVSDAAAFGVPSRMGDEDVMVSVVLRDARKVAPEDLLRHLDGRLAYFAIPRYVEFVDELPLTENGKIRRTWLKERGVTPATWDRESVGYKVAR